MPLSSSITSFLIYGIRFDKEEEDLLIKGASNLGFALERYLYDGEYDIYELLSDLARKMKLEYYVGQDSECYWLGISPAKIRDKETGAQFKERVEESIFGVFGVEGCKYHEEVFLNKQEE